VEIGTDIRRWLSRFIARNQSDFFIHKRLKEALSEDLDIFLKTEVLDIDQLLAGAGQEMDLPRRALKVARIVREVGQQIIDFLAALEDFQKALWEKKKLVLETRYVITLDRLERYAPAWLAQNIERIVDKQRQEWKELGLGDYADAATCIRRIEGDLATPAAEQFLPLPVDTGNFDAAFKWSMLEAVTAATPLDDALDGLAIYSDNWQALNTLREKYRERVKCIYIDPPYNTGGDGFSYKDAYPHSSWTAMMDNRIEAAQGLMAPDSALFVSLDDREHSAFRQLANRRLGAGNFIANVIWQKNFSPKNSARHFSEDHDHILVYARNAVYWLPALLPRTTEMQARYTNPGNDKRGVWTSGDLAARNPYSEGIYPIICPSGRVIPGPPPGTYWRVSRAKFHELDKDGRVWWGTDQNNVPRLKRFLSEVKQGRVPQTIWSYQEVGHTQDAKKELLAYTNLSADESVFNTPKPTALIRQILKLATDADGSGEWVADFFAGSGTTGHAVLSQNLEDRAGRRFLLVECNTYFRSLLIPRLKKAAAIPDQKKPDLREGLGLFMRVQQLEQYDDTLESIDTETNDGDSGELLFQDRAFALRYRLDRTSRALYCGVDRSPHPSAIS
jgi:adenine-specific DNA-methyltransferase